MDPLPTRTGMTNTIEGEKRAKNGRMDIAKQQK